MKARGVVDCAVVVTRYFGGILLGAGGLVRAYSHTCALALDAARVCQMHPTERWLFEVAYPLWDRVQHALKSLPARLVGTDFAAAVSFELDMKAADTERVLAELTRVTDGRVESLKEEERFAPVGRRTRHERTDPSARHASRIPRASWRSITAIPPFSRHILDESLWTRPFFFKTMQPRKARAFCAVCWRRTVAGLRA